MILAFAIGSPLWWLLYSTGRVGRSLKMSLVYTPIMIASYCSPGSLTDPKVLRLLIRPARDFGFFPQLRGPYTVQ